MRKLNEHYTVVGSIVGSNILTEKELVEFLLSDIEDRLNELVQYITGIDGKFLEMELLINDNNMIKYAFTTNKVIDLKDYLGGDSQLVVLKDKKDLEK